MCVNQLLPCINQRLVELFYCYYEVEDGRQSYNRSTVTRDEDGRQSYNRSTVTRVNDGRQSYNRSTVTRDEDGRQSYNRPEFSIRQK